METTVHKLFIFILGIECSYSFLALAVKKEDELLPSFPLLSLHLPYATRLFKKLHSLFSNNIYATSQKNFPFAITETLDCTAVLVLTIPSFMSFSSYITNSRIYLGPLLLGAL